MDISQSFCFGIYNKQCWHLCPFPLFPVWCDSILIWIVLDGRELLRKEWKQCKRVSSGWYPVLWLIKKFEVHELRNWRCFLLRTLEKLQLFLYMMPHDGNSLALGALEIQIKIHMTEKTEMLLKLHWGLQEVDLGLFIWITILQFLQGTIVGLVRKFGYAIILHARIAADGMESNSMNSSILVRAGVFRLSSN